MTVMRTNANDQNLIGDWYFGIVNNGETNISYTAVVTVPAESPAQTTEPLQLEIAADSGPIEGH